MLRLTESARRLSAAESRRRARESKSEPDFDSELPRYPGYCCQSDAGGQAALELNIHQTRVQGTATDRDRDFGQSFHTQI